MNYNSILELSDSLNNVISYSIKFVFKNSPKGEFYNLVIGKTKDGNLKKPSILKYSCNKDYVESFVYHNYDMRYFNGTISLYKYQNFFSNTKWSRTSSSRDTTDHEVYDETTYTGSGGSGDPYNDDNPDDWTPINPEGTGGGSGLGDIDTSGGGSGCTWEVTTTGLCDEGGFNLHSADDCGADQGVYEVLIIDCGPGSAMQKNTDNLDCGQELTTGINSDTSCKPGFIKDNNGNCVEDISAIVEEQIKDDNLDSCSKDILGQLKNLQTNDIAKVIQRFGNPNSAYDWEIKTGTPTNLDNSAETNWATDNNDNIIVNSYTTVIKPSYVNQATNLAIARTILHEAIHAYIISYIDDLAGGHTQGFSTKFPDLWNNFISKKYGVPADNIENYHHQEMAENFVDITMMSPLGIRQCLELPEVCFKLHLEVFMGS